MENDQSNTAKPSGNKKPSLTPRELIKRHMEYPDSPITDDDMNNLKLSDDEGFSSIQPAQEDATQLSDEEKIKADKMANELGKDNAGMSYKADI